jgi:hypothetical protein
MLPLPPDWLMQVPLCRLLVRRLLVRRLPVLPTVTVTVTVTIVVAVMTVIFADEIDPLADQGLDLCRAHVPARRHD